MFYYLFHIGDYQSHTNHLSELEDLAYRRMLDWYYLHERPLPCDPDEVGRIIRMRSHSDCIANVLREFFTLTDDGWVSHRVVEEIKRTKDKSEKASASAKSRWHKEKQADDANALRTQSEGNAPNTQDPIPKNQEHKTERSPKGSRLQAATLDPEWEKYCRERRPDLDPKSVFEDFSDYWKSVAGAKGIKTDWFLTWKSWVRRQNISPSIKAKDQVFGRRAI